MYTRAEISQIKQNFWTSFGRFISFQLNSEGEKVNWVNYHTGYKDIYFRMDADSKKATISIQLTHTDSLTRMLFYDKFESLQTLLTEALGEEWVWEPEFYTEQGKQISKIYTELPNVNVLKQEDWPQIISFLKPRMIALDRFWNEVKDVFEELR